MDKIMNWCSNKENIKILIMTGLAIVLLVVLKIRFGGTNVQAPDSAAGHHDTTIAVPGRVPAGGITRTMPDTPPVRSGDVMVQGRKSPPVLERDIFSSRKPEADPIRIVPHENEETLALLATITDGQGALAIIGNEVLGIGDRIKGLQVKAIRNNEVVLAKGEREYVLRIKEE